MSLVGSVWIILTICLALILLEKNMNPLLPVLCPIVSYLDKQNSPWAYHISWVGWSKVPENNYLNTQAIKSSYIPCQL